MAAWWNRTRVRWATKCGPHRKPVRKTSQESADLGAGETIRTFVFFFFICLCLHFIFHTSSDFFSLQSMSHVFCFFFRVCKCTFINEYKDGICKLLLPVPKTLMSLLRLLAGSTATGLTLVWSPYGVCFFLVSLRAGNKKCQCLQLHTHIPAHAQLSLFKCLPRVPGHF